MKLCILAKSELLMLTLFKLNRKRIISSGVILCNFLWAKATTLSNLSVYSIYLELIYLNYSILMSRLTTFLELSEEYFDL